MTLYFDTKAQFIDGDVISTVCAWHPSEPIFAVSNFHQDRGASVTIFDDTVSLQRINGQLDRTPTSAYFILYFYYNYQG